jgi:hypothetical protein
MGMPAPKYSRRRFGIAAGSALAATAGLYGFSRRAGAVDVGVNSLTIDDQTLESATAPEALLLTISGDYAVDANVVPERLKIIPQAQVVGSAMNPVEFEHYETQLDSKSATGTFDLERNLMQLMDLRDLFPATEGETVSRDVTVFLLAAVYGADGQIGTAETQATFTLTLTHAEASAQVGIEAVGNVRAE